MVMGSTRRAASPGCLDAAGIGRRRRAFGASEPPSRRRDACQPTDVAWDSEGNIYVTDGYVNSRVAKFDKNGDWDTSFGDPGAGPGQFRLPHAIVIDRDNNLYVGDRSNRRIQVFDTNGKFQRMFTIDVPPVPATKAVNGATPTGGALAGMIGAPNSICITPGPNQVLFVGESTFPGSSRWHSTARCSGSSAAPDAPWPVLRRSPAGLPSETRYAAETSNWRVQKLILHPQTSSSSTSASG